MKVWLDISQDNHVFIFHGEPLRRRRFPKKDATRHPVFSVLIRRRCTVMSSLVAQKHAPYFRRTLHEIGVINAENILSRQ